MEEKAGPSNGAFDINKMSEMLEPEVSGADGGGLFVPKDRPKYIAPEKKSLLGLDVRADEKRRAGGVFKVPRERLASMAASLDENEKSEYSILEEGDDTVSRAGTNHSGRNYREKVAGDTSIESDITDTHQPSPRVQASLHSSSQRHERDGHGNERRNHIGGSRYEARDRRRNLHRDRKESHEEYGKKRGRYEDRRRTPSRSDWDDGRWEWEDTPGRDSYSSSSRHHQPSPSPMFLGASPDARLVSPWMGDRTPRSTVTSASPWDYASPSPVPIRASGSSVRSSSSRYSQKSHQLSFSREGRESYTVE